MGRYMSENLSKPMLCLIWKWILMKTMNFGWWGFVIQVQCEVRDCSKCPLLVRMLMMEEAWYVWEQVAHGGNPCTFLSILLWTQNCSKKIKDIYQKAFLEPGKPSVKHATRLELMKTPLSPGENLLDTLLSLTSGYRWPLLNFLKK